MVLGKMKIETEENVGMPLNILNDSISILIPELLNPTNQLYLEQRMKISSNMQDLKNVTSCAPGKREPNI